MYHTFSEEELRGYCRTNIEALEKWARFIINRELTKAYGDNYFNYEQNGEPIIKNEVREKAETMIRKEPGRFKSKIDTLYLEEIIYILCKDNLYKAYFSKIFKGVYPNGCNEARTFLKRLIPIRNRLSHSTPISIRDAEQATCYSHDFIDGIKQYLESEGQGKVFNVPHAIRLNDSLGNEFDLSGDTPCEHIEILKKGSKEVTSQVEEMIEENELMDFHELVRLAEARELEEFHVGDTYSVWLTMDPTFEEASYDVIWDTCLGDKSFICDDMPKEKLCLHITEDMVGEQFQIECRIVQKKNWHRYAMEDQRIMIIICVVPPVEEL